MMNDYAIVIAGHGSRDPEGISEFEQLAKLIRNVRVNVTFSMDSWNSRFRPLMKRRGL